MTSTAKEIAVLGVACRLPGAPNVDAFWQLLSEGRHAIRTIGPDRWAVARFWHPRRSEPGKTYSISAGLLENVYDFDATFFGISPREATQMDPQQRLLLEATWEAMEDAGLRPSSLAGSGAGVYVGASGTDHANVRQNDPAGGDMHLMTGNTLSIISNRISYIFDLRGPSYTVDTACSSSLLALHQAAEAIRSGEVDTAVVAGVNLLLSPFPFVGFSRASMLSPTGLCHAFDARADGYVRAEGCVAVVLQSMERARDAGNRVRAVLAATGTNSDGRTVGLSLPSADSQAALLQRVYDLGEIDPEGLAFIEAHGTGTQVGDPSEAQSIGQVLGMRRTLPLPIGSAKTNVGHLEPASGLVGLLKALLALEHDLLPASLHFETPNPNIPFDELNLAVAGKAVPLPRNGALRYAGVNSFGFGGTNVHAVLRDVVRPDTAARGEAGPLPPLVISARCEPALKALASAYRERLEEAEPAEVPQVLAAAGLQRDRLSHRLVLWEDDPATLVGELEAFERDGKGKATTGRALAQSQAPAFVFAGNGSQWAGMGRAAYATNAAYRDSVEKTDALFAEIAGWSIIEAFDAEDLEERLRRAEVAQPLLFALQVGLVDALAAQGLRPGAVAGHSVGEVAAAYVAGALSLEQAVHVVHARSLHQERTRGAGTMAALLLPAEDAAAVLAEPRWEGIQIAAVNGPRSITISGDGDLLKEFAAEAKKRRWPLRRLDLDYPFHGPLMEPVREPLLRDLADLAPSQTAIPFISTVTGKAIEGAALTGEYWWHNVREPVRFRDGINSLAERGFHLYLEIGPRPVLQGYVNDCLREGDVSGRALPGFDRNDPAGVDPVRALVARALAVGAAVEEEKLYPDRPPYIELPSYPWQRKLYEAEPTQEAWDLSGRTPDHPLLGFRLRPEVPLWTVQIDHELVPYLADHQVEEAFVFPAAGFVEMALAAGEQWLGTGDLEVQDLEIFRPLVFDGQRMREVQLRLSDDGLIFEVFSRARDEGASWNQHLRGRLARLPVSRLPANLPEQEPGHAGCRLDGEQIYAIARRFGLNYGPAFARVQEVEIIGETRARVRISGQAPEAPAAPARYLLHPTALDSIFHGLFALLAERDDVPANTAFLPARLGRVRRVAEGGDVCEALIEVASVSPRSVAVAFRLFDSAGSCVAALDDCRFRAVALSREQDKEQLEFRFAARPGLDATEVDSSAAPAPSAVRRALQAAGLERTDEGQPEESWLLLDGASRSIAFEAIAAAVDQEEGGFTLEELVAAGRLAPDVAPLFGRLLQLLEEDGAVRHAEDGTWHVELASPYPPASEVLRVIAGEHPDRLAEVALSARVREVLPAILSGGAEPPADLPYAAALLDQLAEAAPSSRSAIAGVVEAVERTVADWPEERPLRILELGSGNGALTRRLLRRLPPERYSYLATDPDKRLAERLKVSLGVQPGLEVETLDLAAEVSTDIGPFDLVVCAGELHRAAPGDAQLAALRNYMAGGGLLVAVEPEPSAFLDMLYGVQPRWWDGSADPEHARSPLKEAAGWKLALEASGFLSFESVALAGPGPEQNLLIARNAVREVRSAAVAGEGAMLLLADAEGAGAALAAELAHRLREAGRRVVIASAGPLEENGGAEVQVGDCSNAEWLGSLADSLEAEGKEKLEVIHMAGALTDEERPSERAGERCRIGLAALHGLASAMGRLWLVTPGAMQHLAGGEAERPTQAALWGFGRVATNEYPGLQIKLVDPAPDYDAVRMAELLATEILQPTTESELVFNRRGRHALRLRRGLGASRQSGGRRRRDAGLRLEIRRSGSLDQLAWMPMRRRLPGPGEVEIEVAAAGLNFRDVMWAMGLLPDEALEEGFAGPTLGMECAGVVTAVGEGVTGMQTGARVLSFAPACFASHVTVSTRAVAPIPGDLTFEQAATVPSAFFTAYYALVHLARLEAGERILVHGGAGGVGLAALQLAKWCGAEVFATAGSPEKRAFLRLMGADHVLDSRSLQFADEILAITGGEGVDVVLNSLAGEAMERSLQVVRPFGRFLELGKRDFYAGSRLGLRPFRQNISFFGIDADQLLTRRPQLAGRLFREMVELFREGHLRPLPYRRFDHEEAVQAFRLMQQSGHIGKIVVGAPPAEARRAPEVAEPFTLRDDATYLVAGGLGGFGLETARWLVERGARHLLLLGRSGASSDAARAGVEALRALGAEVVVEACDLADRAAVAEVVQRAAGKMPPLRGVLHTAMVLDDGLIANLDAERFDRVLRPKVEGAWNLDRATRDTELDFFVLYSSATTTVGNPGQANYVAANAYLESLARQRRAEGLPGLAVAWGAIGDAGYLARHAEVSESLSRRLGRQSLAAREALDGLERILQQGGTEPAAASPVYARIDWRSAGSELAILGQPGFRELLAEAGSGGSDVENKVDLRKMVEGLDVAAARDLIAGLLAEEVARILRLPAEEVDRERPLAELGMDSLMALELRMAAEQRLDIEVPLMSLADGTTLSGIAARLAARLVGGEEAAEEDEEALALARKHLDEQDLEQLREAGARPGGTGGDVARIG